MRKSTAKKSDGTSNKKANKLIAKNSTTSKMHVGLDVHKKSIQIAAVNNDGKLLFNKKIGSDFHTVSKVASKIPKNAKYVMESSSVWYGLYRYMTDILHLDVVLSNPYDTKVIASSLKKTDRIDACQLANLLRGGYIAVCHVPDDAIVGYRQLVRHRNKIMRIRTKMKNSMHGITLQKGAKAKTSQFTLAHMQELKRLEDYRINSYLDIIQFQNKQITKADSMIRRIAPDDPNVKLLTTIPGVGFYSALAIFSEIADIDRFNDSHKLCSYAGVVPSVRNSADTIRHGRITKNGSNILRWVFLVEAVHTHVRYANSDSDIAKFYQRLAKKRGASKAAVAAASKLLRVIYRMLKERRGFVQNYS